MAERPTLCLVYESEPACRERLLSGGTFDEQRALEVSSYLAQSTDIAKEFGEITSACAARGIDFRPVELSDLLEVLPTLNRERTLVWPLTDGTAFYRGSSTAFIAQHLGFDLFGSETSSYAICQDKFQSGAVLRALELPAPEAGLAVDRGWLVEPPASPTGYFVKPNLLGAKIGIWPDSHCRDLESALDLSNRIYERYWTEAIVQPYVPGRNARVSYLAAEPVDRRLMPTRLGVYFVDSGADFQTMADSMALYGDTSETIKGDGLYREPVLEPVALTQPRADALIRDMVRRMVNGIGLNDVFSVDLRVEPDDTIHVLEFEVCPGLPCFDFRAYCKQQYGLSLAEAMAIAASDWAFDDRPYAVT